MLPYQPCINAQSETKAAALTGLDSQRTLFLRRAVAPPATTVQQHPQVNTCSTSSEKAYQSRPGGKKKQKQRALHQAFAGSRRSLPALPAPSAPSKTA